jgi:methylated-DNA-[protein]-cysteine S-methyltransferase
MCRLAVASFQSILGPVHTAATEIGLAVTSLPGAAEQEFRTYLNRLYQSPEFISPGNHNTTAESQIQTYLAGERELFEMDLDFRATPFQRQALLQVAQIPYGETRTYGEIARLAGSPGAARAVGHANASNPLPLVIPCHRVVASGGLGGYGGGLEMKRWLLDLEGALLPLR